MTEPPTTSRALLEGVLSPHVDLAIELLGLVQSRSTSDPSHRFHIVAMTEFLAGVDKTLSLALEMLYLTGHVEWKWMTAARAPSTGVIECTKGMQAKLGKLKSLGVNGAHLDEIVRLRNEYLHDCIVYLGYSVGIDHDDMSIRLRTSAPTVTHTTSATSWLDADDVGRHASHLVDELCSLVDDCGWDETYRMLTDKLERLPQNPEPERTEVATELSSAAAVVDALNKKHVGEGAAFLME